MMPAILTALTLLFQFVLGFGILMPFRLSLGRLERVSMAMLIGLAASTVLLFVLECFHIPLKEQVYLPCLAVTALALQFATRRFLQEWKQLFTGIRMRLQLHEMVLMLIIGLRLGAAVWRAYYQPVIARDSMVGMDLAARYAVHEGHFVSGLFTSPITAPSLSNQPYYAPFTSFSLVIYRLTGMMFGSLWLVPLTLSFCTLLYTHIRRVSHPIVAGFSLILLVAAPEVFSYFSLVLTDLPSMAFMIAALLLIIRSWDAPAQEQMKWWAVAALMMGFACWSRSDTVVHHLLWCLALPFLYIKQGLRRMWKPLLIFAAVPLVFFAAWSFFFVKVYFPSPPVYDTYPDLFNLTRWWRVVTDLVTMMLMATQGFGFFFWIAIPYQVIVTAIFRDRKSILLLTFFVLTFLGLTLIAQVFPDATVGNTLKRSVMKLYAIGLLGIGYSVPVQKLCVRIKNWQQQEPQAVK